VTGDERRPDGGEHPLDVDARFADIVAHFHDGEPTPPQVVDDDSDLTVIGGTTGDDTLVGPGTAAPEDLPLDQLWDDPEPDGDVATQVAPTPPTPESRDERMARIDAEIERAVHGADGGHYVPPEPPPIPRPGLPGRVAWAGVLLGPVLLLLCALLWQGVPQWVVGTLVTGIVAGFGYLVWRLPRTRDREDPDDGAIV
jgi:hypothetical protein